MNRNINYMKFTSVLASMMLAGWLLAACSQTAGQSPNIVQRIEGEAPAAPPQSGFLAGDYSLLQRTSSGSVEGQKAMLAYINANGNFAQYNKVMIAPVTFWADSNSQLSAAEQQHLCNYAYTVFQQTLSKNFALTNDPGPGVLKFSAALTDATSATPVLRTASVVIPQAHALNMIKYGLTGKYAFVGSATAEAKLTDSVSGELLGAWQDQRFGSAAVRSATVWQWGDADNAMKYWANALDQRLVSLGVQQTPGAAASSS